MKRLYQNFASDQRGSAAIEFAFIGIPFLALLYGIAQLAMVFFAGSLLDMGVRHATRFVLTGQAQQDSWAPAIVGKTPLESKMAKFRQEVCTHAGILLDCNAIKFDLRVLASFNEVAPGIPFKDGEIDDTKLGFSLGAGEQIVLVRAMYLFPAYSDLLGSGLVNVGTNKRLIVSSAIFVNEPF